MPPFQVGTATLKAPRRIPDTRINPDGRQLRRFERQLQEVVLQVLTGLESMLFIGITDDNVQEVLTRLDAPETAQTMQDALLPVLEQIALSGADFGRQQVEREVFGTIKQVVDWELANEAASEFAQGHTFELVRGLLTSSRRRLQREITRFVGTGETIGQLRDRLTGLFGRVRAELIAVTEVTRVYAEGNQRAWTESGVIERNRWNTANDEIVCPICGPNHDKIRPIGESFPSGDTAPPAHPRCRCWLTPQVDLG